VSPQTSFLLVREDTKAAVLLYLLRNVVRPQDQTVVFVATKHHAEYLTEVSRPRCRAAHRGLGRGCRLSSMETLRCTSKLGHQGQRRSGHGPGWGFCHENLKGTSENGT
jgi:superfamily II DNA/RNA helicase